MASLARNIIGRVRRLIDGSPFRRLFLLASILAVLSVYKLAFSRYNFTTGVDGGYYADVARHIRDGDGLVSSCAILYKGYPSFPHPTGVYPLWPLLVGYTAKLFPLLDAAKWLATGLYYATLLFSYLFGRALCKRPLLPKLLPSFGAGHLLVLIFGLHHHFFKYTTQPYTEGFTYTIVTAALWRFAVIWRRPSWRAGLELGAWCGLGILVRYQLVLLTMAAVPVLIGAVVLLPRHRRKYALMGACATASLCLVVAPHYLFVRSFVADLTPWTYLQWQHFRFSDALPVIPDFRTEQGALAVIWDRLKGFGVAFSFDDKWAYRHRFHAFQYAAPAALVLLLVRAIQSRTRRHLRVAWKWLRRPSRVPLVYFVVFALGSFLSIHWLHMNPHLYPEWYFGGRHGLVCTFLFFLSLVLLLLQQRGPWRMIGVFIVCASSFMGWADIRKQAAKVDGKRRPAQSRVVKWLNAESAKRGGMVVAMRKPQLIAYATRGVGYHWYYAHTKLRDVRAMVDQLGVAYVVVPARRRFPFQRSRKFDSLFRHVTTVGGMKIYQPRSGTEQP